MDELAGKDLELRISKPGFPKDQIRELRKLSSRSDQTNFEYIFYFDADHPLTQDSWRRLIAGAANPKLLLIDLKTRKILWPKA